MPIEKMEKTLLIPKENILKKVKELAEQLSSDYKDAEPVFIGILNGAVFFFADIVREVSIPVEIDFIRAASYGSGMESSGNIQLTKDVEVSVKGKPVILIEDIIDTGLTLSHIVKSLKAKGPKSIRICTLINKLERRETAIQVDYFGFQIKEGFIVGYGLDYDEKYRQLPDIYALA